LRLIGGKCVSEAHKEYLQSLPPDPWLVESRQRHLDWPPSGLAAFWIGRLLDWPPFWSVCGTDV